MKTFTVHDFLKSPDSLTHPVYMIAETITSGTIGTVPSHSPELVIITSETLNLFFF
jgi:hypothetical protein